MAGGSVPGRVADARALACFVRRAPAAAFLVVALCGPRRGLSFARVYAYFRVWDDRVDVPLASREAARRAVAAERTRRRAGGAATEWCGVALERALTAMPGLGVPVDAMWAALEADAARPPEAMPAEWLEAQRARIGDAYADALWACAGAPAPTPDAARALSRAATRAHQARDLREDLILGYVNVSPEDCAALEVDPSAPTVDALASWARAEATRAASDLASARSALAGAPWRARWLLGAMAWRYRRVARTLTPRTPPPAR